MLAFIAALGDGDCEAIDTGWLAQPVNANSSLAYTVAGLACVIWAARARTTERLVRWLFVIGMVATGIGSFLYHGPQTTGDQFAHDVTFLAVLGVIGIADVTSGFRVASSTMWAALALLLAAIIVTLVAWPGVTNAVMIGCVALVAVGDIVLFRGHSRRSVPYAVFAASMALALGLFLLGRTGAPLCDPETFAQGHAGWHVLGAAGLVAYAVATGRVRAIEGWR